jgi:hypothetical protein
MESFLSSLKTERIRGRICRTRDEARAGVFDHIERFYNPRRRRSTIGYLSPMDFEALAVRHTTPGVYRTGSRPVRQSRGGSYPIPRCHQHRGLSVCEDQFREICPQPGVLGSGYLYPKKT